MSEGTLPVFQRSIGNQEVTRMLAISRQAAAPATAQQRPQAAAFDQARAVAYNRERFTFDQSLVDQLNQVVGNRELYAAVTESRQVGPEFAQLVYAAQQVLFPSATNDGMLGPGTLRTVRRRTGHASTEVGLAANGRPIPERQVRTASPNDPASERTFSTERTGGFIVTGGYMEASGHATKRGISAIMSNDPDNITALPDSGRNLGIDYVVQNRGKDVNAWYGGLVTHSGLDGGYGYRVIVETDVTYLFNGREYTVFQGYGHNRAVHVRKGSVIEPGARIATMGGTGSGGAVRYAEHVDLRTWIMVDGKKVDVSPNLLDQQIASRRQGAGPQAATRQPGSGQATNRQTRTNGQAQTNGQPANQARPNQQQQGDGGGGGLLEEQMAFTSPFEGGRQPRVYTDTEGHPTVGIGFNLDRSDARRRLTDVGADYDKVRAGTETLSNQQMDTLFRQDVEHFTAAARGIVSNFDSLPRTAQLIIVDMTFNLGSDGFSKFRKAIAAFERNDFETAAAEMQDSTWYGQVGRRSRHHVAAIRALATAPQGQTAAPQPGNAAPTTGGSAPTRPRVAERPAAHPRPAAPATSHAGNPIGTATVTADVLNVRQGPNQTAPRVGRLQRSQVVQVVARQGEWLQIRYGSSTAFIHGDHATFRPRAQQAQAQPQQEESLLDQASEFLGDMWDSATSTIAGWFGGNEQAPAQNRQPQPQARASGSRSGAPTRNPNAILSQIETTGASAATARQDGHRQGGVESSERMAQRDFNALKQYAQIFVDVGAETGLPPALLAAIASRESRGGAALDRNGYGDHGNGFGLMQVDKRYHELAGSARSREHIEQAAGILKRYFEQVKAKFPRWSEAQQLRGAVAAYNFGVDDVRSLERLDIGSTGNDYSADVWARARYYAGLPEFGGGADMIATTPQVPTRARQQQGGQQTGSGRDISGINVSFGPNADASVVSQYTLQVLKECLAAAGERNATITSTSRTPRDQARAMYNNIVANGVASQRALYAAAGDQVIDAYVASKEAGKDRDGILADMTAAIQRIGPGRVSKHCADPAVLGVIDVGPSSVENKAQFVAAVEADPRVSNFLHPGNSNDPAYHIEIPQR